MSKVSVKGVLVGGIIDIVATNILAIPLVIYVMIKYDLVHTPEHQMQAAITAAINGTTSLYASKLLIGLGCTVLGGYIAAWLAKHDELLNGLLSSFLCVAFGVYSLIEGKTSRPLLHLLLLLATPAIAMLGGYFRAAHKRA